MKIGGFPSLYLICPRLRLYIATCKNGVKKTLRLQSRPAPGFIRHYTLLEWLQKMGTGPRDRAAVTVLQVRSFFVVDVAIDCMLVNGTSVVVLVVP
eukprot:6186012-Pleurochrysis_carterae.AAC.1